MRRPRLAVGAAAVAVTLAVPVSAHDGPPFPIVSDRVAGPYRVSIWTDPDATDDGSAGGQFWVILDPSPGGGPLAAGTRVRVAVAPLDRPGPGQSAQATAERDDPRRQFAAVPLDHEGRFRVQVTIDSPSGPAVVDSTVDATYDSRPPPIMLGVYAIPFVIVGFLWLKLLLRRRRGGVVRTR